MKFGKIMIALFLCLSLSACKKEEKNIPMEKSTIVWKKKDMKYKKH